VLKGRDYLTIGEVVEALSPDYPEISISKIRFFEDEAIVHPGRTSGGYRKFTAADLDRLRLALRLQKERYLPLHVIRELLAAHDRGEVVAEVIALGVESGSVRSTAGQVAADKVTRVTGITPAQLSELLSIGIVRPMKENGATYYRGADLELLKVCGQLFRYGMEPRHLRMYLNLTSREIAIFGQVLLPLAKHRKEMQRQFLETKGSLVSLSCRLKELLLSQGLDAEVGEPTD